MVDVEELKKDMNELEKFEEKEAEKLVGVDDLLDEDDYLVLSKNGKTTKLKVKLTPRDVEILTANLKKTGSSDITNIMRKIIARANPEYNTQEGRVKLDKIVTRFYGSIYEQLFVLFGFASKDDVEKVKKKYIEEKRKED